MAKRFSGTGTVYEYVAHTLGKRPAVFAAGAYHLAAIALYTGIPIIGGILLKAFCAEHFGFDPPWWVAALVVLAFTIGVNLIGVQVSVRTPAGDHRAVARAVPDPRRRRDRRRRPERQHGRRVQPVDGRRQRLDLRRAAVRHPDVRRLRARRLARRGDRRAGPLDPDRASSPRSSSAGSSTSSRSTSARSAAADRTTSRSTSPCSPSTTSAAGSATLVELAVLLDIVAVGHRLHGRRPAAACSRWPATVCCRAGWPRSAPPGRADDGHADRRRGRPRRDRRSGCSSTASPRPRTRPAWSSGRPTRSTRSR